VKDGRKYTCNVIEESSDIRVLDTSQKVSKYNTNIFIFLLLTRYVLEFYYLYKGLLFLDGFAKLLKATVSFVMSVVLSISTFVHPRETNQLPLDRFSLYLMFEYFFKTCRGTSSLV
jgi:hypothetical protein